MSYKLIAALGLLFSAVPATAGTVVIERFPPAGFLPAGVYRYGYNIATPAFLQLGQTITVQNSGRLATAEILITNLLSPTVTTQPDYIFDLYRGVDGLLLASAKTAAGPSGPSLAWRGVDLTTLDLQVRTGDEIFLTVRASESIANGWLWSGFGSANPEQLYAGGAAFSRQSCPFGGPACDSWQPLTRHTGEAIDMGYRLGIDTTFAPVPEPSSWALMILGFATAGSALRARRGRVAFAA